LIADNFDYRKSNLNDSLVKDMNVLAIGELATKFRVSFEGSPIGRCALNFIHTLTARTLSLFKSKGESTIYKD